ncbi:flagellar motor protein MotB [Novosphingobium ginsenosidimutans]|uniref:OmpA family protein n=1 Tax=Novosphingobium ginsenosidimutans TaxID=1176536 RepID=A0A5B8S2B4_9SPHN|nr:flagellar motor protein MotB [Novosphingobium ginsenosidimutans]QEA15172.1 OmpA family protein [Novosphingobium ginsenosidimutans]
MVAPKKGKPEGPPIIVKKITVVAAGHHGGAWKVAYADFVTAMMAFFLLLWLLGATNEKQRKGLADYFTPTLVKLKQESAGSNGMLGGSSITDADNYPNRAGQTGTKGITIPRDAKGGPKEGGEKVKSLQQRLAAKLAEGKVPGRIAKQVRMIDTAEGIRIDLVDDADFAMFQLGTTVLTSDASLLLKAIGGVIAPEPGDVSVRGHTDALPWRGGGANNWSLSAGRAEATRQALLRQGIGESRFRKIEGVADREPLVRENPEDPRNRRISILLMR